MHNDNAPRPDGRPDRDYGPEIFAVGPGWERSNRRQTEHAAPLFSDREEVIGAVRLAGWYPLESSPEVPVAAFPAGKNGQCGCPHCAGTVRAIERDGEWVLTGGVLLEVPPSMWREDREEGRYFSIIDLATGQRASLNKIPTPKAARRILDMAALPREVRRRRVRRGPARRRRRS